MLRLGATLSLVSLISACAWAPGMHYDEKELWQQDFLRDGSAAGAADTEAGVDRASAVGVFSRVEKLELTPKTVALESAPRPTIPEGLLAYTPEEYRLGVRDAVQIIVWDHPELTLPAGSNEPSASAREIDARGYLFIPYVGPLKIAALTVSEARDLITKRLGRFIESPQVDLIVRGYNSQRITVGGEVMKPGVQALGSQPVNLLDAIGVAGGFTELADQTRVTLVRDDQRYTLDLARLMQNLSADIARVYMKAGDVIQVADNTSQRAYVIGEVLKPQPVPFTTHGLTLTDALGTVGGVSQLFSDAESVYVVRAAGDAADQAERVARIYHLDASSPLAMVVADSFQLRPRDVVFVGAAGVTRWNRVISQLLPSLTVVDITDNIGR